MSWLEAAATGPVVTLPDLPVFCNALYADAGEARAAARGDLVLWFSPETGYLWNGAFDPALVAYNPSYENSLHHSDRFRSHVTGLADRLIDRYDLHRRTIVEIGCGEGNFLALLCERGENHGIGYDPSFDPDRTKVVTSCRMEIVREYYPTERPIDASLVVCQHVLEHVTDPVALVEGVRRSLPSSAETAVYFEVPDATYMVSEPAVWDLTYEHRSYFAAPTLRALFRRSGFEVLEVGRSFGDQYLYLEARAGSTATPTALDAARTTAAEVEELTELAARVATFGAHVERLCRTWTERVASMRADGEIAIWGAGTKGVTFANLIAGAASAHMVDINPNKWGLHVPGTGQAVVAPASLGPGLAHVLVMNPLYVDEVAAEVRALGLQATVSAVSD